MSFAKATAVVAGERGYSGDIHPGWDVVGNANGGYLMAIAARARAAASRERPVALSALFRSPGRVGPVTVDPQVVKAGRTFSTVRATLASAERPLVELLGSFSDTGAVDETTRIDAMPPDLPPVEECARVEHSESGFPPALMQHLDMRLHPQDSRFYSGEPSGKPLVRGWVRLADDEPMDAFALLLMADAFPPTIFNANLPVGWTPTLEMTAHVRAEPVHGWLRCRFSTRFITGGLLEEDGVLWDDSGRLVAQSRQLALLPRS